MPIDGKYGAVEMGNFVIAGSIVIKPPSVFSKGLNVTVLGKNIFISIQSGIGAIICQAYVDGKPVEKEIKVKLNETQKIPALTSKGLAAFTDGHIRFQSKDGVVIVEVIGNLSNLKASPSDAYTFKGSMSFTPRK